MIYLLPFTSHHVIVILKKWNPAVLKITQKFEIVGFYLQSVWA